MRDQNRNRRTGCAIFVDLQAAFDREKKRKMWEINKDELIASVKHVYIES